MSKTANNQKGAKGAVKMISKFYDITGEKIKCLRQTCPRCGDGVFLADHKDRRSCGKCGYSELLK